MAERSSGNAYRTARDAVEVKHYNVFHTPCDKKGLKEMAVWDELAAKFAATTNFNNDTCVPQPIVVLGDFNSCLLKGGDKVREFAVANEMIIAQDKFTKSSEKKLTFKGTKKREAILDAVLVQRRWQSSLFDGQAYQGPI